MNTNIKNVALAFFGALALTACKKETVETTTTDQVDGDTVVTTTTTTETHGIAVESDSLKAKWEKAKQDVKDAVAKGDKKAQEAAQKTADEAEAAWNKVKTNVKEDAAATKEKLNEAKEDLKENYNEALEKAKAK
ncbi:hypothetical protein [Flavobacterium sp.]|uniref:hypothetical protein n=1 Tax=Flavobacterium sp. TaxID=239 RepID=UPI0039E3AF6B